MHEPKYHMDNIIETAERWIKKLTLTTDMLNELSEDTKLPNGWGKRELLIHLSGWDEEFIGFASEMRKKVIFYAFYEEEVETKNQQFIENNKELDFDEVNERFNKFREELTNVYKEILNQYPQDNREFMSFFSIWWHDLHHLKQAGLDISHLEE
ncbi:MAG: hypothetical protein ACTSQF_05290 [Candidatus Heimdallarchaeaceae archaeon]